jgi:hypothetical protein
MHYYEVRGGILPVRIVGVSAAGEAGKGFAVVANEALELASKQRRPRKTSVKRF